MFFPPKREALIKSLAESLIIHEKIETTIFKAKELVPYVEKLITKAKLNTLHSRRQVIKGLQTVSSAHKLVDELAPKLQSRNSGYFRISRTTLRRGDNAQLASVSFILDDNKVNEVKATPKPKTEDKPTTTKAVAKKPVAKVKPAAKAATKSKEVK